MFALVVAQLPCPLLLQNVRPRLPDACCGEDVSRSNEQPTVCSSALQYTPLGHTHVSGEFAPCCIWLWLCATPCCGLFVFAVGCVLAVLSLCVRCSSSVGHVRILMVWSEWSDKRRCAPSRASHKKRGNRNVACTACGFVTTGRRSYCWCERGIGSACQIPRSRALQA